MYWLPVGVLKLNGNIVTILRELAYWESAASVCFVISKLTCRWFGSFSKVKSIFLTFYFIETHEVNQFQASLQQRPINLNHTLNTLYQLIYRRILLSIVIGHYGPTKNLPCKIRFTAMSVSPAEMWSNQARHLLVIHAIIS